MVCVIIHLYYTHLFEEIHSYLKNIKCECKFYITIPKTCSPDFENKLKSLLPNSYIKRVENKGEDIGAFMNILEDIDVEKYKYFFKIHTKKNNTWRNDLLKSILDVDGIDKTIDLLSKYKMVGSAKWRLNSLLDNAKYYDYWCTKFGYKPLINPALLNKYKLGYGYNMNRYRMRPIPHFVAGSMFACSQDIIMEIKSKNISQSEFEDGYQSDKRKEHAFERFFSKIVQEKQGQIAFV